MIEPDTTAMQAPTAPDAADPASALLEECHRMAVKIEEWRLKQSPKLSMDGLYARFKALGSTRSFERFRDNDVDCYRKTAGEWLGKIRGVYHIILMDGLAVAGPEIYDDLSSTIAVSEAVLELAQQVGNTRLVVVEGNTGAGKTEALHILQRQIPGSVLVTVDPGWRSLSGALRDLAIGIGLTTRENAGADLPISGADKLAVIYRKLGEARVLILIDEAHELTAEGLNLVKALINNTNCVIVISAMDTLWKKLQSNSWQEAKQLVYNRLFRKVRLTGPDLQDAQTYFLRRCNLQLPAVEFEDVIKESTSSGLFAFMRRVADHMLKTPDRDAAALQAALKSATTEVRTDRGNRA